MSTTSVAGLERYRSPAAMAPTFEESIFRVDISEPLLELSQQRAISQGNTNLEFFLADAQDYKFEPQWADRLVSRFGVMFFSDPVAAFKNMATGLKPNARIVFAAWASASTNPWFKYPRDAAIDRLGKVNSVPPRTPGPTAFAEQEYVTDILNAAGFKDINVEEKTIALHVPGDATQAGWLACQIGPVSRIVKQKSGTEIDRKEIESVVVDEFKKYEGKDSVEVPAQINFVTCRQP